MGSGRANQDFEEKWCFAFQIYTKWIHTKRHSNIFCDEIKVLFYTLSSFFYLSII